MFRGGPKILNMVAKVSAEFVRVCFLYDPSTFVCYPFEKLCPLPVAVLVCCNLSIQACALPIVFPAAWDRALLVVGSLTITV